jgi:pimeloyl-ACP methyl ester carboxylesterase
MTLQSIVSALVHATLGISTVARIFRPTFFFAIPLVSFMVLLAPSGHATATAANAANSKPTKLIFWPGYYGSKIAESVDDRGRVRGEVFLTLSNLLFGSTKLKLKASLDSKPSLVSSGILDSVSVIPWLYSIDAYGETVERVQDEARKYNIDASKDLYVFDYDWRLDPVSILKRFDEKLVEWKLNSEEHDISIVAHSMGGWLMSYWLRYGSQTPNEAVENWAGLNLVKRVMFVAAPFRGTLSVFRNSFWGAPGIPNSSFLGAGVISSFPSTYYLTPNEADFYSSRGEITRLSLKKPTEWIENRWGALQESGLTEADEASAKAFVEFHVQQSAAFQEKIHAPLSGDSVQSANSVDRLIQIYIGEGYPTNELGLEISRSPKRFAFTEKQIRKSTKSSSKLVTVVDGDETVSTTSAQAPQYLLDLGGESFTRPAAHLAILRDGEHIDWKKFLEPKKEQ